MSSQEPRQGLRRDAAVASSCGRIAHRRERMHPHHQSPRFRILVTNETAKGTSCTTPSSRPRAGTTRSTSVGARSQLAPPPLALGRRRGPACGCRARRRCVYRLPRRHPRRGVIGDPTLCRRSTMPSGFPRRRADRRDAPEGLQLARARPRPACRAPLRPPDRARDRRPRPLAARPVCLPRATGISDRMDDE